MTYRLAMLDVDGTLKKEADWIPGAQELLEALGAAGIAVALCSGREIASLQVTGAHCPTVGYLAGAGGSIVQRRTADGWTTLGERFLPRAFVDRVAAQTAGLGGELWLYTNAGWLVRERTPRVEFDETFTHAQATVADFRGRDDVTKLLMFAETAEQEALRDRLAAEPGIGVASSYPGYWDILPAGSLATKGGDLLIEALGCGWDDVLAAGDGSNDLGMLAHAGLAFLLAPRRAAELEPDARRERVEVPGIAAVLAELRSRGVVA